MNYDHDKYELYLSIERAKRDLNLSFANIVFDPSKHKRDLSGKFAKTVESLKPGQSVRILSGKDQIHVTRDKKDESRFHVHGAKGIGSAPVRSHNEERAKARLEHTRGEMSDPSGPPKEFLDKMEKSGGKWTPEAETMDEYAAPHQALLHSLRSTDPKSIGGSKDHSEHSLKHEGGERDWYIDPSSSKLDAIHEEHMKSKSAKNAKSKPKAESKGAGVKSAHSFAKDVAAEMQDLYDEDPENYEDNITDEGESIWERIAHEHGGKLADTSSKGGGGGSVGVEFPDGTVIHEDVHSPASELGWPFEVVHPDGKVEKIKLK